MDKYEYKVRADEIKTLISEGRYADAVKIADSVDWRRVKSVMMLCTISDLYKINRRYEDSRDILLLAYERHAGGRLIVYSLCELSIKLGEFVQALEYYKEFVQLAPKDSGRYVLQYKIYEAQEVSLEERIEVLEELKKRDYREKWAYELAYLYHRVGLASKCVEECDEMFLWFGEGRYVLRALELKMLHEPLSEDQQMKYEQMKETGGFITSDYAVDQQEIKKAAENETEDEDDDEFSLQENILTDNTQEIPSKDEMDIQVKTVDVSQYNTINLQKELAESMKEILELPGEEKSESSAETENEDSAPKTEEYIPLEDYSEALLKTQIYEPVTGADIQVNSDEKTVHFEEVKPSIIKEEPRTEMRELKNTGSAVSGEKSSEEVFFGNTEEVNIQDVVTELEAQNSSRSLFAPLDEQQEENRREAAGEKIPAASANSAISNTGVIKAFHKPSGYDNILTQEYDGQISLVVPEQDKVEKQITGQLSIEDIMTEWEKMKEESERRRMEDIRRRVHQQTETLFADFDESTKTGLLEELEKAMVSAAMKEEKLKAAKERPRVVKVADIDKAQKEKLAEAQKAETAGESGENTGEDALAEKEPQAGEEAKKLSKADAAKKEQDRKLLEEYLKRAEEFIKENPIDLSEEEESAESNSDSEEAGELPEGEAQEAPEDASESEEKTSKKAKSPEGKKQKADKQKNKEEQKPADDGEDGGSRPDIREMTGSEREQFAPFIHHKRTRRQIVEAIDNISMASYTGNVVITGEEDTGTIALAKLLVKEIQLSDSNFSGKVAKISGSTMNKKDVAATLSKLSGGALIIEGAASMKKPTVEQLLGALNQESQGLIVLLEGTKPKINDFLEEYSELKPVFNLRVDVEALDDQTLVKYAKKYALEQEYTIDELGVLALHTRIADMQTSDHEVTLGEIEELVDEAIYYADRKTPQHFVDVLLGKRYDEEDMIVLREKDFMHY
ncbi:hypothetical protein D5282_14870 [bacterium 1xD8-48]|nr:hypothetical protein [Lachnospiraceae bacterium]NBJ98565.1 hypothetical protein [bacterium 1xD8-48]